MKNISFEYISKDILKNRKFQRIASESHHGITRMEHSLRVARFVYKISKKLNLDYVSATRAAILHDFFTNEEFGENHGLIQGVVHPHIALQNASGEFELNDIEKNAIEAHMYPLCCIMPKYKESWVLTATDKIVAIFYPDPQRQCRFRHPPPEEPPRRRSLSGRRHQKVSCLPLHRQTL